MGKNVLKTAYSNINYSKVVSYEGIHTMPLKCFPIVREKLKGSSSKGRDVSYVNNQLLSFWGLEVQSRDL